MKVGTKSLLFGYHQFLLHPLFVWAAWVRLYGWTWDPRVVLSFFLHDLGYWGKPNMDGVEGKQHPFFGAMAMHVLFDWDLGSPFEVPSAEWYKFSLYHSRTLAGLYFGGVSRLGYADKLAFLMYPYWLIRLLGGWSGENKEYIKVDSATGLRDWLVKARTANIKTLEEAGLKWR